MKKKLRCNEAFMLYMNLDMALKRNSVEYPASAIIHGSRNRTKLYTELEEYIKRRDDKITELANGSNSIDQDNEAIKKFNQYMEQYNKVEIEIDITTVPVDDFMKFSYKPDELMPFEFMID